MSKNAESKPAVDQAFLGVLTQHRNGALITDLSAAIKQVTAAVQLTGKPGKVTLSMSLKPASAGSEGTLVFEPKVKTTVPETAPAGSIFYADSDYNLVREDPNQRKLPLQEVAETPTEKLRELE